MSKKYMDETTEKLLAITKTLPLPPGYAWHVSDMELAIGAKHKSLGWVCYVYYRVNPSLTTMQCGLVKCFLADRSGTHDERFDFGKDFNAALQFIAHRTLLLGEQYG